MRLLFLASTALLLAALVTFPSLPAAGQTPLPRAVEAIDGDSLRLEDGTVLRLAGILAPDQENPAERAVAAQARATLQRLAAGRTLAAPSPDRRDRHDRRLLHVETGDGLWLQGELLSAGLARVWTQPDAVERAKEMLALEARARADRRGIWALPSFAILTAETAGTALDRFQIVEFKVMEVARVRGTIYLNAGKDWRSDFTARLEPKAAKLLADSGQDTAALKGRTVRVRGMLRLYNGPFLDITHPQQIEAVDP